MESVYGREADLVMDADLPGHHKLLLTMVHFAGLRGGHTPSYFELSVMMCKSERMVRLQVSELTKLGLLSVEVVGGGSRRYTINYEQLGTMQIPEERYCGDRGSDAVDKVKQDRIAMIQKARIPSHLLPMALELAEQAGMRSYCSPRQRVLAERLEIGFSTAKRQLAELAKLNIITIGEREVDGKCGPYMATTYSIDYDHLATIARQT